MQPLKPGEWGKKWNGTKSGKRGKGVGQPAESVPQATFMGVGTQDVLGGRREGKRKTYRHGQ